MLLCRSNSVIASQTEPPSSPSALIVTSQQNLVRFSIITLNWDPPSFTGGVSVMYILTISLTPLSGSPVTVETTSAQITISYNTPYNVSIRAVNCAGMSNASMLFTTLSTGQQALMCHLICRVLFNLPLFSIHAVSCPSSLSTAIGVVNVQTPSVPTVDSTLTFTCSGSDQIRTSICGSDGRWNPNPENFVCPTIGEFHSEIDRSTVVQDFSR